MITLTLSHSTALEIRDDRDPDSLKTDQGDVQNLDFFGFGIDITPIFRGHHVQLF